MLFRSEGKLQADGCAAGLEIKQSALDEEGSGEVRGGFMKKVSKTTNAPRGKKNGPMEELIRTSMMIEIYHHGKGFGNE